MNKYKDMTLIFRTGLYGCLGVLLSIGGITAIENTALFISILVTVIIIDIFLK